MNGAIATKFNCVFSLDNNLAAVASHPCAFCSLCCYLYKNAGVNVMTSSYSTSSLSPTSILTVML